MFRNVCRVCSKYASGKKSLNIFDERNEKLLSNIQIITGFWLEQSEWLPELICECCHTELQDAIKFRERCIDAQYELLKALKEDQLKDISNEYKDCLIRVDKAEDLIKPDGIEEYIDIDNQILEEVELPQDASVLPKTETDIETADYEVLLQEDTQKAYVDESIEADANLIPGPYEYDSDDEVAVLDNVLDDEFELDLPKKSGNKQRKPARKEKKSERMGSGVYICEQCGNHVSGRKAFELHCRRHRGDKQFPCEICQSRFCTTSELKRHMRKHTGERPFPCQYCGRRFTDYTTRVKHERTHTNERPYACLTCGKAFTTGYILKNHMLVHSGERAFKCEMCDKSFLLSSHLSTHYRSIIHKRNLEKHAEKNQEHGLRQKQSLND